MRKYITELLKFTLLCSIIYVLLIFAWGKLVPQSLKPNLYYAEGAYGFLNTRIREAEQTKDVDILFLGSSHAYRGFDVRIFAERGYSSFNLGSSAQTPVQTIVLLKRYLKNLNPKLVVFEVYPGTFCSDGVESSLDVIANDGNDLLSARMMTQTRSLKTFNTFLYGAILNVLEGSSNYAEPLQTDEDTYITGGYVERTISYFRYQKYPETAWKFNPSQFAALQKKWGLLSEHRLEKLLDSENVYVRGGHLEHKTSYFEFQKYPERSWKFNELQFEAFQEILSLLDQDNIKTLLVFAPVTKALYNSYDNMDEFETRMQETDHTFINFNGMIPLDDSLHFYDAHHLNQNGVTIFNQKLLESIPEL